MNDVDSKKKVAGEVISTRIGDDRMTSTGTRHEAMCAPGVDQYEPGAWSVTWLPDVRLDRNEAITAMTLAEYVDQGVVDQSVMPGWIFLKGWARELNLTAVEAVNLITEHSHTVVYESGSYETGGFTEFDREEFMPRSALDVFAGQTDEEMAEHMCALLGGPRMIGQVVRARLLDANGAELGGTVLPGRGPTNAEVWSAIDTIRTDLNSTPWGDVLGKLLQHSVVVTALADLDKLFSTTHDEDLGADPCRDVIERLAAELPDDVAFPPLPDWFSSHILSQGEAQNRLYLTTLAYVALVEAALAAVAEADVVVPELPGGDVEGAKVYTFDCPPVVPERLDRKAYGGWLIGRAEQMMQFAEEGAELANDLTTVDDPDRGIVYVGPADYELDEYAQALDQAHQWPDALLAWANAGAFWLVTGLADRLPLGVKP